jgi:hypothetical protein
MALPQMTEREPVSHAIASIIDALDCIAEMALQAENYDEVAAQEVGLGRIISRAQLVLSFLDTHRPRHVRLVN